MAWLAVQTFTSTYAGKEKGARRRRKLGGHPRQQLHQVLFRGLGIAQMELDGLEGVDDRPHRQRARLGLDTEHVSNEKVPLPVFELVPHLDAEKERALEQGSVPRVERLMEVAHHIDGSPLTELVNQLPVHAGDEHRLPDGTAALRYDGMNAEVSMEGHEHAARPRNPSVDEKGRLIRGAAREPAHDHRVWKSFVEAFEERTGVPALRVEEGDDQLGLSAVRGQSGPKVPPLQMTSEFRAEGLSVGLDARQAGGGEAEGGSTLELPVAADDASGGGADHQRARKGGGQSRGKGVINPGDREREDQVGVGPGEALTNLVDERCRGSGKVVIQRGVRGPAHVDTTPRSPPTVKRGPSASYLAGLGSPSLGAHCSPG